MTEFVIKSSTSDLTLKMHDLVGDYFKISLQSSHLNATRDVYAYDEEHSFVSFIEKLAAYREPWSGEEFWGSLETELTLTATCDPLGHVTFKVFLSGSNSAEEWSLETEIRCDFGQLEQLPKAANAFFSSENHD